MRDVVFKLDMTSEKILQMSAGGFFFNTEKVKNALCLIIFLLFNTAAYAAPPPSVDAQYLAQYGRFKASAERSVKVSDSGQVEMSSVINLKMLGKSLSSIREQSLLVTDNEDGLLKPSDYSFTQTGLGKRRRQITFDWAAGIATAISDRKGYTNEIPIEGMVVDKLSADLELRNQLLDQKQEIHFSVIDKGVLEEIIYEVIGEEEISTSLGTFRTVRLKRVREPGSERSTDIWLALDWDYLLVKLVQIEGDSSDMSLELKQATVNGVEVVSS